MIRTVALVTDSSACLPPLDRRRLDVRTVPIQVQVAGEDYRDGVDLDGPSMYRALEEGVPVKSSAPTALDYLDAIEETSAESVVLITPATEFTWMYRNACLASELASKPVAVVDSRSASAGHGLVVLAAGDARERGGTFDDVVSAAEDAAARVELVGCLESLDFLRASGRVPALALGLASQLGVRPVFRFRRGEAERVGLPRTEGGAFDRIVREWGSNGGRDAERSALFHAGRPDGAEALSRRLGGASFTVEFSPAMAIHTGPGVVGVAWLRRPGLTFDERELGSGG